MTSISPTLRPFTHGAVVTVLLQNSKSEVLLMKRLPAAMGHVGSFNPPGGGVELGETVQQAAVREVHEEIGVTVAEEDLRLALLVDRPYPKGGGTPPRVLEVVFACTRWQGKPTNKEPHKHENPQWFALDALPENVSPYVAPALGNVVHLMVKAE